MVALQVGFPDAETVVMDLLSPLATTVTATGNPLVPPVIQVQRTGGSDNGHTDQPRIEVVCIGADRPSAWVLAEQARQLILASTATKVGDALVDKAITETPAQQLPDLNPDVRRVVATYRLSMRRPRQH